MKSVPHECMPNCPCKVDLDAAVAALTEASRLLSASILSGSEEIIEERFGSARIAWLRLIGARAAYKDHFVETA